MPSIPELLNGHVTLEVECLGRLYLNGYIGPLATSGGLFTFMREQLGKPIPSPVVLGQITEKFRDAVKAMAEREQIVGRNNWTFFGSDNGGKTAAVLRTFVASCERAED
jgi:hypothetical protein